MFPFKIQKTLSNKQTSIPQIQQPQRIFPLISLPFYIEASQPLNINTLNNFKNDLKYNQQSIQKYIQQKNHWQNKYTQAYQQNLTLKYEIQQITKQYNEKYKYYQLIDKQYHRLKYQIQLNKNKKQNNFKIVLNDKKKQKSIPVVKINVPNLKCSYQQPHPNQFNQQLKSTIQQLNYHIKQLQQNKQNSQQTIQNLNKNMKQLIIQKDSLKRQHNFYKQQNNNLNNQLNYYKQQNIKLNNQFSIYKQQHNTQKNQTNSLSLIYQQKQKFKSDLQRLQKIHNSCNILLNSKQQQIQLLQLQLDKFKKPQLPSKINFSTPQSFHFQLFNSHTNTTEKQKPIPIIKQFITNSESLPSYTDKKINQLLKKYEMILPIKDLKYIQQFIKIIISEYIIANQLLQHKLNLTNQKIQHHQLQIQKLYQLLLINKKIQVNTTFKDLQNFNKIIKNTPTKQDIINRDDQYFKSLFKPRRDSTA